MRVRLFEKRTNGGFYRETHVPGKGRDQAPLHTHDRDVAERFGRELLANLLTGQVALPAGPLTLGDLWNAFKNECAAYLDNEARTRKDEALRVKVLLGHFGSGFDVRRLNAKELADFTKRRLPGGIVYGKGRDGKDLKTGAVRQTSVHADLALLRRMIRWATTQRLSNGQRRLDFNPLDGLRFDRERNPRRAVASIERFKATREAVQRLEAESENDEDRLRWRRLDMALFLAEATGRRQGSIVGLRWEDFDFAKGTVLWRAEHDKKGKEWLVPMPLPFMEEMKQFRQRFSAVAGPLFPGVRKPEQPMPAELLTQWLAKVEAKAGLPKLAGSMWHAYRRKFATERMHHPLRAVADAGGWKDVGTLLTCYQQTDEATLLAVMGEARKLSERRSG
jgi:integrase